MVSLAGVRCSSGSDTPVPLDPDANGDTRGQDTTGINPETLGDTGYCNPPNDAKIACGSGEPLPTVGAACGPGTGLCQWAGGCGYDRFYCCGTWAQLGAAPPCSNCPSTAPTAGSACSTADIVCGYQKSGGRYCDRTLFHCTGGVWDPDPRDCASGCPLVKPTAGADCPAASSDFCQWASDCHSIAYAQCLTNKKWGVTVPCP